MFTKTVHGRTERERGTFMEIEQAPIGFFQDSSGARVWLSFLGAFPDSGGYRRAGVHVYMSLDEAEAWAARLAALIRRAKLPIVSLGALRLVKGSAPMLSDGNRIGYTDPTHGEIAFTLRLDVSGPDWILVDDSGADVARVAWAR
jgi:hypothetical protein